MTGLALLATIVIGACVGSAVALLTDWLRTEMRRYDAGLTDLGREIDTDRAHTRAPYNQEQP